MTTTCFPNFKFQIFNIALQNKFKNQRGPLSENSETQPLSLIDTTRVVAFATNSLPDPHNKLSVPQNLMYNGKIQQVLVTATFFLNYIYSIIVLQNILGKSTRKLARAQHSQTAPLLLIDIHVVAELSTCLRQKRVINQLVNFIYT